MSRQGERDAPSGRFTHSLDARCVCGHTMGQHLGGGPAKNRECTAPKCSCEGFRVSRKKNPRKGRVPPQLRRFLFKRGHGRVRRKNVARTRTRRRNPPIGYESRARRFRKSIARRALYIITATKAGKRLCFDGKYFSNKHAARKFPTIELAANKAHQMIRANPILRSYAVHVRRA